jgi:hypothetical protein
MMEYKAVKIKKIKYFILAVTKEINQKMFRFLLSMFKKLIIN